jgi:hypothetical protein
MKADVERFSHQPEKHFRRVLEQQGRVALSADFNEQTGILLHHAQALARDLIGPDGTPAGDDLTRPGDGFRIGAGADGALTIAPGHYWVEGLLCENDAEVTYAGQPDLPARPAGPAGARLVYLDVWERHVAAAQDDSIRDVALGGPDTCSRSKLVWQVKLLDVDPPAGFDAKDVRTTLWPQWRARLEAAERGRLAATVDRGTAPLDPCQVAPDLGYFGNENQLYRVEVHRGSLDDNGAPIPPTFKWSRDNGSSIYPLLSIAGTTAVLRDPPLDERRMLAPRDLVEVVDDHSELLGRPGVMARVVEVDDDGDDIVVRLSEGPSSPIGADRHPLLRRWDHPDVDGGGDVPKRADDGALVLAESAASWLSLEDGIRIRFGVPDVPADLAYRPGDFWTFPARAATGDITWPWDGPGVRRELPPHGIDHHFAPLAVATVDADGKVTGPPVDCRLGFAPLAVLLP